MNEKDKRTIYWYLKEKLDNLEAECSDCNDIDCGGNYVHKLLKKKHQWDVIDRKDCKKKMKVQAKELRKIVNSNFFKKQRMSPCHHCKKLFERDEMGFYDVARFYNGSVEVDHFCKDCVKKFKLKR